MDTLVDSQYACRRARGAGLRYLELADFVRKSSPPGKHVYIAFVGVDGALGIGPHALLLRTAR